MSKNIMSTSINDLNDHCLEALFQHFNLYEWVKILRVVCSRWYGVLNPLCLGMMNRRVHSSEEILTETQQHHQPGHYFYRQIHILRMVGLSFMKSCFNKFSYPYEVVLEKESIFYEKIIRKALIKVFGDKLIFCIIHVANYDESNRVVRKYLDDFCPMLLSLTIFGYVELEDKDFFLKLTEIIQGIQMSKNPYINADTHENKVMLIKSPNIVQLFHSLTSQVECYSLHYTGECSEKFSDAQLFGILLQMRPERLSRKFLFHNWSVSIPFYTVCKFRFTLTPQNLQIFLPFMQKHFKYSNFLKFEFRNQKIKLDQNLMTELKKFCQLDVLKITNVSFDLKSLNCTSEHCSIPSVRTLRLKNVDFLNSSDSKFNDELDATIALLGLFPNLRTQNT